MRRCCFSCVVSSSKRGLGHDEENENGAVDDLGVASGGRLPKGIRTILSKLDPSDIPCLRIYFWSLRYGEVG